MPKKEESDSDSDSEEEPVKDPSMQKANDLKKFTDEPIKIPGGEVLTAEPQATLLVTNLLGLVLKRISDPALTTNIMDNISKSVELSLENKKNKIEYLKHDTGFKNKNNSLIINSIHNSGSPQPTEVITHDDIPVVKSQSIGIKEKNKDEEKDEKDEIKDEIKDEKDEEKDEKDEKKDNNDIKDESIKIKGGRLPFFTEQECSFF